MKAARFLFSVALCTGVLGIWGVGVVLFAGAPLWAVLVTPLGFFPLASAAYEAFGRDNPSEFVFFDGDGWFIMTALTTVAVSVLAPAAVLLLPGGALFVGLLVLPSLLYYLYYLADTYRRGKERSDQQSGQEDTVSAILGNEEE